MTVDTRTLRTVTEAALTDSEPVWTYVDGPLMEDVHVETRPQNPGRSKIRIDPNTVGPFIAAASPGTVLALLDEVDVSRAPEAHWECQQRVDVLEETLATTAHGLAEALAIFDASWCPEHGHAPNPEQLARIEELRKLKVPDRSPAHELRRQLDEVTAARNELADIASGEALDETYSASDVKRTLARIAELREVGAT